MRTNLHLQERHLVECVRQNVITQAQLEGILAVARSMAHAEGTAAPDFRWVTAIHATAAVGALGMTAVYLLDSVHRFFEPLKFAAVCAVAAVLALGLGALVRQLGQSRVPAAILTAGAAMFAWGVGTGLFAAAFVPYSMWVTYVHDYYVAWESVRAARLQAYLAGDVAVILAAAVIGWRMRVAAVAGVAAVVVVHMVMGVGERLALLAGQGFSGRHAVPWLVGASVLLVAVARLGDRVWKGRQDPAFWLHAVGILPLGFAGAIRIDREPREGFGWIVLACVVGLLGVRWGRKSYLAASGAALLFYPAFMAAEAHAGDDVVIGVFVLSVVAISFAAALLRRYLAAQWIANPAPVADRSIWE